MKQLVFLDFGAKKKIKGSFEKLFLNTFKRSRASLYPGRVNTHTHTKYTHTHIHTLSRTHRHTFTQIKHTNKQTHLQNGPTHNTHKHTYKHTNTL